MDIRVRMVLLGLVLGVVVAVIVAAQGCGENHPRKPKQRPAAARAAPTAYVATAPTAYVAKSAAAASAERARA